LKNPTRASNKGKLSLKLFADASYLSMTLAPFWLNKKIFLKKEKDDFKTFEYLWEHHWRNQIQTELKVAIFQQHSKRSICHQPNPRIQRLCQSWCQTLRCLRDLWKQRTCGNWLVFLFLLRYQVIGRFLCNIW